MNRLARNCLASVYLAAVLGLVYSISTPNVFAYETLLLEHRSGHVLPLYEYAEITF
jgi:hypothetical protein